MSRGRFRCTAPPAPDIPAWELEARVAAVKAAKVAKLRAVDTDSLTDELDVIFAETAAPDSLRRMWGRKAVPPCAKCKTRGGEPQRGRNSYRPCRISGRRFGIDAPLCKACYDMLDAREAEQSRAKEGGTWPRSRAN